jgi:single-strand DNA-binding protein
MARSLNSVQLIGNLTRDPELRYTPTGVAVCTIGIATNRNWTTDSGEKKEEVEFHRVVAWNKLAELCSQLLSKGSKVYVHGRLSTRSWTGQDGQQRSTTEIIIDDMIVLSGRKTMVEPEEIGEEQKVKNIEQIAPAGVPAKKTKEETKESESENISPDDIPF